MKLRHDTTGFTLVELMITLAIAMVMAAVCVPSITEAIAHMKLRGASGSLAGLIQGSRMQAVKRNKTVLIRFISIDGVPYAFTNDTDNLAATPAVTDLQVQLGSSTFVVAYPSGGTPPIDTATLSYTPLTLPDLISFNPRGLPCKYVAPACTTTGFVYYLTDTTHTDWIAVSVSPGGRVKQWFWNGTVWAE